MGSEPVLVELPPTAKGGLGSLCLAAGGLCGCACECVGVLARALARVGCGWVCVVRSCELACRRRGCPGLP